MRQIVISVPNEWLEGTQPNLYDVMGAVMNGTVLPEHHGDLKDVSEVIVYCDNKIHEYVVKTHNYPLATAYDNVKQELMDLLTIIPATKEKNSEKVIGTDVCSFTDKVCIGKDCRICDINNQTATKEERECTDCKWYGFTCECPVHCTQDTKIAWESATKGESR